MTTFGYGSTMTPYHHGSLRGALLDEARRVLARDGLDGLTMRGLAKSLGVSHGAPRRHFVDRDALLDALVAAGFAELTAIIERSAVHEDSRARLVAYVSGHMEFAKDNAALMPIMFTSEPRDPMSPASQAAGGFFRRGRELLGDSESGPPPALVYLLAATTEGIASLAASGRLPADRVHDVVDLAVDVLLHVVDG